MENMLELLHKPAEIVDIPNALELDTSAGGGIEFNDVYFHYDDRSPTLRGVSFKVPGMCCLIKRVKQLHWLGHRVLESLQ